MHKIAVKIQKQISKWWLGSSLWVFDLFVAAILTGTAFFIIFRYDTPSFSELICKDGTAIFGSILSTEGSLLGFAIVAITIAQSIASSDGFSSLRSSDEYENFWAAFTWSVRSLAISTLVSLMAMFTGHIDSFWIIICSITVWSTFTAILGLFRSVRTLEILLDKLRENHRKTVDSGIEVVEHYPDLKKT